jgi:hypothetical protein
MLMRNKKIRPDRYGTSTNTKAGITRQKCPSAIHSSGSRLDLGFRRKVPSFLLSQYFLFVVQARERRKGVGETHLF